MRKDHTLFTEEMKEDHKEEQKTMVFTHEEELGEIWNVLEETRVAHKNERKITEAKNEI